MPRKEITWSARPREFDSRHLLQALCHWSDSFDDSRIIRTSTLSGGPCPRRTESQWPHFCGHWYPGTGAASHCDPCVGSEVDIVVAWLRQAPPHTSPLRDRRGPAAPAVIDGEALVLDAPLHFRIRPGVLWVRIAREHPERLTLGDSSRWHRAGTVELARIAFGRNKARRLNTVEPA